MDFFTAFEALSTTEKVANNISSVIKNSRGHKRAVLRELHENLDLLLMIREKSASLEKVIPKLSLKYYIAAADSGFNFKQIKRGSLKEKTTCGVRQFKKYIGWSTERLFENIYLKVKYLQNFLELKSDMSDINFEMRVEYLTRMMILFFQHIRTG
jgi:hypothetical protein